MRGNYYRRKEENAIIMMESIILVLLAMEPAAARQGDGAPRRGVAAVIDESGAQRGLNEDIDR
jgi:hypothetical protein